MKRIDLLASVLAILPFVTSQQSQADSEPGRE